MDQSVAVALLAIFGFAIVLVILYFLLRYIAPFILLFVVFPLGMLIILGGLGYLIDIAFTNSIGFFTWCGSVSGIVLSVFLIRSYLKGSD